MTENPQTIRAERTYAVHICEECGCETDTTITVPAGSIQDQEACAWQLAEDAAEEWVRQGDYGDDGAVVSAWISLSDGDHDMGERDILIDIEPNHDVLIAEAGGDVDCDHDWTSEGEGGCRDNPGVWGMGATAMKYRSHCTRCGLHRTEYTTGAQRNPGDHDSVEYSVD